MDALLASAIPAFESGSETEICNKLQEFTKENAGTFSFADVQLETKKKFVGDIFRLLEVATTSVDCQLLCLEALKIFSRDKYNMLQLEQRDCILLLLKLAGLGPDPLTTDVQVITEAQKCLCNLVFNSSNGRIICCECDCAKHLLARTKKYTEDSFPWDTKYYDMRLLFLLTALVPSLRATVRNDLSGVAALTELLETQVVCDIIDKDAAETNGETTAGAEGASPPCEANGSGGASAAAREPREIISVQKTDLAGEILKALFNVIVHTKMAELQTTDESVWKRLGVVLRSLLMTTSVNEEKTDEYHSHTVNMLTHSLPAICVQQLIPEPKGAAGGSACFQGYSMECVMAILDFLEKRIDKCSAKDSKHKSIEELVNPPISALCSLSRGNRYIRKYLKEEVLPPIRDASKLPEEGDLLRNKLVRLMTNPSTEIKGTVEDFIFILCKESVNRMIKYTGYGNAAGMLARRGLLMGGHGNKDYSDESDSDTEEYREIRDRVNPITGRVEDSKADPMEGMSEEQKEFHAMELANMITKMTNEGVITPMTVGVDGRLITMEEAMQRTQLRDEEPRNGDDSDVD